MALRKRNRPSDAPATDGALLVAKGVRKLYQSAAQPVEALRGIDLSVPAGEWLAVMGPSGSGKTTLLNCLSGLDGIDEGEVWVAGTSLASMSDAARTRHRARHMGFIFQAFNLIPVLSAAENVELPLLLAGERPASARKQAEETLERVGLGHRLGHRPSELSGGEQQRVATARALAGRPSIIWADEPTGNLDSETARQVTELLGELNQEGMTVILVTHDAVLGGLAHRCITVKDGMIVAEEGRD